MSNLIHQDSHARSHCADSDEEGAEEQNPRLVAAGGLIH